MARIDMQKAFIDAHNARLAKAPAEVIHLAEVLMLCAFDGSPPRTQYIGPSPVYFEQAEFILSNPAHREAVIKAMQNGN